MVSRIDKYTELAQDHLKKHTSNKGELICIKYGKKIRKNMSQLV